MIKFEYNLLDRGLDMFRFKKIIPCVLLSACVASSVCVMSACNSGADYSEDIAKLQQQIEDLQTENSSLKDKLDNLTPSDTDYTEKIEKLQQQIETLKSQNTSYAEESDKLKQQIETLKTNNANNVTEISKLESQLATLKTSNESNFAEIENLQKQIAILQQASSNELKTYKIGETFTLNYCDTYIFSITLETRTKLVIRNIKSPAPLRIIDFIQIQQVGCVEGITSTNTVILDDKTLNVGAEYVKDLTGVTDIYDSKEYFGIPLSDKSILPYAVFDLTPSSSLVE